MDKKVDAKIIQVGIVPQVGVLQLNCECDPSTMRMYLLNDDLKLRPLETDYSYMIKKDFVVFSPMTVGERVLLEYSKPKEPLSSEKRVGVLVKDMEMPSECNYCGFCRCYTSGRVWCNAKNKILREYWEDSDTIRFSVERPEWCPLEEVGGGRMSVMIKDFKMPKDCDHCAFQHEDDEDPFNRIWRCYITGESISEYYAGSNNGTCPEGCPLTEVLEDEDSKIAKQAEMVIDRVFKTTRVAIFYKDVEWAKRVYEYIKTYAPYKPQCSAESFSTLTPTIHFAERDIDVIFAPEENCCGRRCDKVFYQPGISKTTLDEIVFSIWTPLNPMELNI